MKKRTTIAFFCFLLFLAGSLQAQTPEEKKIRRAAEGKAYTQEELVSFQKDVPYNVALESLGALSKKFLKKPIIDPTPMTTPIGVEIQSMYWKDAFELILRTNNLWYAEKEDYLQVAAAGVLMAGAAPGGGAAVGGPIDSSAILAKSRDVIISAIFLEINTAKQRESGINFSFFRGHGLNLEVGFSAADKVTSNVFQANVAPSSNNLTVDVTAALKIFESEQIGEVIARPQTVVKSGSKGRIVIGTSFSVKQRDFSGNITDMFFDAGTILEITPKIYTYGAIEFIDLPYHAERSSVSPGTVSTIINKTTSDGRLIVLNGEETYVGGLYSNDVETTREGIPILKDLPWWFFGLRYIFGYDNASVSKKELIILLKAELAPTVEDRVKEFVKGRDVLKDKLKEYRDDIEKKSKKN
jgi:general secretion pathway protein D